MLECQHIKIFFAKDYVPNWSKEYFAIKKVKNNLQWTYFICDHNREEIVGRFYEKEFQKTTEKEFRGEMQ